MMISLRGRLGLREALITTGVCAGMFLLGALLSLFVPFASAIPLFICILLFIAWKLPLRGGVLACFTAAVALDFFFTEPRLTFRVLSSQDVTALCSFLVVVVFISFLSHHLSQRNRQLTNRDDAQRALQKLAERSIQLDWRESVAEELCRAVCSCFSLKSVCIWDAIEQRFACAGEAIQAHETLRAAFMAERDFDLSNSRVFIRVLRSGVRPIGTIQLQGEALDAAIVGAVVSLVSLTMERARALNSEVVAQSESMSEQLRSSVLDGLAHSIKTPLTTISVAASGIAAVGGLKPVQDALVQRVQDQAERITSLTDRLLRMARMDSKMVVKRREADICGLIRSSLLANEEAVRLRLTGLDKPLSVLIDPDLVKMAVIQIAENALKYSPPDSVVDVSLGEQEGSMRITIHNAGTHIPAAETALVFKRFYRGQGFERRAPGTGLGLSVAKHAVEALGGQIDLDSAMENGTTFTILLPLSGREQ